MLRLRRSPLVLTGLVVSALLLSACTGAAEAAPSGTAVSPAADALPVPGRTVAASEPRDTPGVSLQGYRLMVVHVPSGEDASALAAMRAFAADAGAAMEVVEASGVEEDAIGAAFDEAVDARPDLVVGLGASTVDVFSFETAQVLDQQFLVVGAQLAEPTANVTAVIWSGATSRGSAVAADGPVDAGSLDGATAREALAAGIASVRDGVTGVVIDLDAVR